MYESSKIAGLEGGKIPRCDIRLPAILMYTRSRNRYVPMKTVNYSLFGPYLRSPLGEKGEEISPTLLRTPGDLALLNETRARMLLKKIVFYIIRPKEREILGCG